MVINAWLLVKNESHQGIIHKKILKKNRLFFCITCFCDKIEMIESLQ